MTCKNFSGERDSSAIKSRRYPRLTWFPFASLMRSTTLSASASDTRFTCASWSCMAPISGVAAMNVPALARRLLCSSSRSASARPWFRAGCMRWRAVLAPLPRSARQAAACCLRRSASGRDSSQTDLHISEVVRPSCHRVFAARPGRVSPVIRPGKFPCSSLRMPLTASGPSSSIFFCSNRQPCWSHAMSLTRPTSCPQGTLSKPWYGSCCPR